jgi:hypothetical protein
MGVNIKTSLKEAKGTTATIEEEDKEYIDAKEGDAQLLYLYLVNLASNRKVGERTKKNERAKEESKNGKA